MPEDPKTETTIQTVDEKGTPPKNRITTAAGAWGAFENALKASSKNDDRFASIRGIYDGFPPEDPAVLEQQGLQNAPNFNTRQFQAKVNSYVSTWVDLNTGDDQWFEVKVRPEHCNTAEECKSYSEQLTKFFNAAIKEWDGEGMNNGAHYVFETCVKDTQMGLFGLGLAYFQDPIDFRFCAVPTRKVHVPQGTKITLHNCPALFLQLPYTVTQLYNYVKDEETAKRTHWDRTAVLKLLYTRKFQNKDPQFNRFSEWENSIRNNASELEFDFSPLELVNMYIQEFTTFREKDKVSHYIIAPDGDKNFLYEKNREYDSFNHILVPFADNSGPEGDWHGVKGFGDLIYDNCHFNNQMFNHIAIGAILASLPMFESETAEDKEKMSQIVFSRMGILFPGLKLAQVKLNSDISGNLAVLGESNRMLNANTRIFPQNDQVRAGQVKTATQETFDRQDQAQFTSLQIQFYRLTGADRLGHEMYRRLSQPAKKYPEAWPGGKIAKKFRDNCEKFGISEKCRMDVEYVRASRGGGTGNMGLDSMKADQAIQVSTPGMGQMNARKEKIKALYGADMVSMFIQEEQPPPGFEEWAVMMENTTLQNGQFIPAFPFQPVEIHLGMQTDGTVSPAGHLGVLQVTQQAATQLQEAGVETALQDAIKLNKVLEAVVEHIAMHGQFMRMLPKLYEAQTKELDKLINDAQQFNENLANDIANAMQKAQEQQPQVDPETAALMRKTEAQIEADKMKAIADIEIRGMEAAAKVQNMAAVSESRQSIKEQETNVKLGIQAEEALIDQQRQQIELAAKTRAQKNAESVKE